MSHDVYNVLFTSVLTDLQQKKNIPMLFHSPFNESTLAFLDIQVIHLHVNLLNVYTCIILFMWSILQSPIYLLSIKVKKGHKCIHWPFHWNGVILFMPNMKSLCLVDQKLWPMRFFFYQKELTDSQTDRPKSTCLWKLSISWAYTDNLQFKYG